MPGVYIDMTEHAIIDVDTGRALAIIDSASMTVEHDRMSYEFIEGNRETLCTNERVTINLQLTALVPEFAEGFKQQQRLNGPLPSATKLLTNR